MRRKHQLTRNRVQFQNRLECLLEEAHIKLSSLVSDLLGKSARRMLQAVAEGATSRGSYSGHWPIGGCGPQQSTERCAGSMPRYSSGVSAALKMALEELQLIEEQIDKLDQEMARVAECSTGRGAASGGGARTRCGFSPADHRGSWTGGGSIPSAKHLASWVGVCPGEEESAGVNYSHRSPKGNRQMKGLLNQAANAAVRTKGSIFEFIYRRLVPRLGHPGNWSHCTPSLSSHLDDSARTRRLRRTRSCRDQRTAARTHREMIRELRSLGYRVEPV